MNDVSDCKNVECLMANDVSACANVECLMLNNVSEWERLMFGVQSCECMSECWMFDVE